MLNTHPGPIEKNIEKDTIKKNIVNLVKHADFYSRQRSIITINSEAILIKINAHNEDHGQA
jgi:hypothetical protein